MGPAPGVHQAPQSLIDVISGPPENATFTRLRDVPVTLRLPAESREPSRG